MKTRTSKFLATLLGCAFISSNAFAAPERAPSIDELWKIIQQQQKQIKQLTAAAKQTQQKVKDNEEKIDVTVEVVEETASKTKSGLLGDKTSIGGYGEIHYNNLDRGDGDRFRELDLHRFVLFFGHEFTDDIRFVSEFEIEHGGVEADGSPLDGEVEIEQAYLEFDINEYLTARAGVFLLPVGILNETHEPPTFYGVERNPTENIIIPATWWEAGVGMTARTDNGFSFDLALHSGLSVPTTGGSAFRIRSGRQKVSNANADDLAVTGRVKYTGIPGLELATTVQYQSDISQRDGDGAEEATLFSAHAVYNKGPFSARALYARFDIDGDAVEAADGDDQDGFYLEAGYKITPKWGVFARYDDVDGVRAADEFEQYNLGVNYYPHEDVVLKADYMDRENDNGNDRDIDGFNLGVGYQF